MLVEVRNPQRRTTKLREHVEAIGDCACSWRRLFIRQSPEVFWVRDEGEIASQLIADEAVYPHMVHAFSPIVLNYQPSGNDGNRYEPKVESLLPEVELGVAAPVPHQLKEDPGGCEKDHSNQQSIYSRRVNLALKERLREGAVRCSMEAPIMHPVAHAGRPRDVLDV